MGEAEESCSFSLICLEDSADLVDAGGVASAESADDDDGEQLALFLHSDADGEEEEEYLDHLVSKETSFCCSPSSSSSSPVFSDFSAAADTCPSSSVASSSDEWSHRARRATVEWIFQTRACFGFSHRTAYLAVSYMDRFCLHRCMDSSAMPWAARLLAVACVSLAAKMEEYTAPPLPELHGASDEYEFSCASVRRMELLVLSTLGWRMGHVTPLDYLPCLAPRLLRPARDDGDVSRGGLVAGKAAALIFSAAEAASVVDYRPSTVAVAAVLAAAAQHGAMMGKEALESKMMSSLSFSPSWSCLLDKEDVHACYSAMLMLQSESSSPSAATAARKQAAAKRPPPPPSFGSGSTTTFAASAEGGNTSKRARLELPAVGR